MNQLALQVFIVGAFGAICFGCGYLTALIITRNQWRDEMNQARRRAVQLADRQMGMGRAAERIEILNGRFPPPWSIDRGIRTVLLCLWLPLSRYLMKPFDLDRTRFGFFQHCFDNLVRESARSEPVQNSLAQM